MLRFGEHREIRAHGFTFRVDCVGAKHHSTTDSGTCVSRNVAGPYILTYNGKYLARLHPAQVKRWARHFAAQMLKPKPEPKPEPAPTVAFYRVCMRLNSELRGVHDGDLWWKDGVGTVDNIKLATPYTRVQADQLIKQRTTRDRTGNTWHAVPVYA